MGDYITFSEGLLVTFVSIIAVFIVLVLISFSITGLKTFGAERKVDKAESSTSEIGEKKLYKEDGELVAVISAAVACNLGANLPDIKIKTIKKITRNLEN